MADIRTKYSFGAGGLFNGAKSPIKQSGKFYWPPHTRPLNSGNNMTTTAARVYFTFFPIDRITSFSGAYCANSGTGDSGDKFKIALYNESASGGPGTLYKDFGEGTFTGAAVINSLSSSVSNVPPGDYYLAFVTNNTVAMNVVSAVWVASNAGYITFPTLPNLLGTFTPALTTDIENPVVSGDYVGGTYANFPDAPALTPNTTIGGENSFPYFGLKG